MKITDVRQFYYTFGGRVFHLVKLETDEGIYGIGEATLRVKMPAVRECISLLGQKLAGHSVFDIESMFHRYFTHDRWRNGPIMNTAISSIEMAMWDAIGKKLRVPVYNLMGGKMSDRCQLYANGWSKSGGAHVADLAKDTVDKGFKALKWDPISWPLFASRDRNKVTLEMIDRAVAEVGHVRQAVGDEVLLFLELHGRCDVDQALRLARGVEPFRPGFIEEPLEPDDWAGYHKLSLKTDIPLAAGERLFTRHGHRRLYEAAIVSIAQPDFTHCAGLLEAKKMAAMAEAYYVKIAPHNSSGPVATMASIQVDATLPNFYMQEFMQSNVTAARELFKVPLNIEDGCLILDDNAFGLGIDVDFDRLDTQYPVTEDKDW